MAGQLLRNLVAACDVSMPRRRPSTRGAPCYWWTEEIRHLRRSCLHDRRLSQRARGRPDFDAKLEDLRVKKRDLKREIKESKSRSFRKICDEAEINPWGTAYKVVTKKLRSQWTPRVTCPSTLRSIVTALYPEHPVETRILHSFNAEQVDKVSTLELIGDSRTRWHPQ
ncbi:hypothetical protein ACLKA6_003657 [Drosophila palustris]